MPDQAHPSDTHTLPHAKRLAWALRESGAVLPQALQQDRSRAAVPLKALDAATQAEALARLIMGQADPTSNKRFTSWLVREYAAGRLILEDLGSANETLSLFQRYAPRLKPEARDIQRYGSLAAVWEAVRGFAERDEAQSNKAQKALDRAKAYAESRILRQDPDGFTVVVPLTEFAAKWWGRGTRWCTAAEKDNQFWDYHKDAPLLVAVIPNVGKFQLWLADGDLHFMDEADRPVSMAFIENFWTAFKPLILACFEQTGAAFDLLPARFKTQALCKKTIPRHGVALRHLPLTKRAPELCLAAVKQNGRALAWVPDWHLSPELCEIAVAQDGRALEHVPSRHQSRTLYTLAVNNTGWALRYVPWSHRTRDLCLVAMLDTGQLLDEVPVYEDNRYRREIYHAAMQSDGYALYKIRDEYKTKALCLKAVRQTGLALSFVPPRYRTKAICLAAVMQMREILHYPNLIAPDIREAIQKEIECLPPEKPPAISWKMSILDQWASALNPSHGPKSLQYSRRLALG